MAADVRSLFLLMNGHKDGSLAIDSSPRVGKSTVMITQDLLGGTNSGALESTELDLDSQVPTGWEKLLDLKSGKIYLQRSDYQDKHHINEPFPKPQDLMNFPRSSKPTLNFFTESSLDLKLVSSSSPASLSSRNYQSVCTLDKVKYALERAERDTNKKRSISFAKTSSPMLPSSSSSSVHELEMETDYEDKTVSSYAACCSSCLIYVLVSRNNPKCPRCYKIVRSPVAIKKPRIDLNIYPSCF